MVDCPLQIRFTLPYYVNVTSLYILYMCQHNNIIIEMDKEQRVKCIVLNNGCHSSTILVLQNARYIYSNIMYVYMSPSHG